MTIRPLKKSERDHTKSTFSVDPTTTKTMTSREYMIVAFVPNRYSMLTFPKKCQPRIVENAKKNRQTATKISPNPPKLLVNAAYVRAVPVFPLSRTPVVRMENTVRFSTTKVSMNTLIMAASPCLCGFSTFALACA